MKNIKDGEIECDNCEGRGQFFYPAKSITGSSHYSKCSKCKGTGKLDWVENIVGKKDVESILDYNTVTASSIKTYVDDKITFSEPMKEEIVNTVLEKVSELIDEKLLEIFSKRYNHESK